MSSNRLVFGRHARIYITERVENVPRTLSTLALVIEGGLMVSMCHELSATASTTLKITQKES